MSRQFFCLLLGLLPLFAFQGPEDVEQALKQRLCKAWKYEKCRIMGVEYAPKPAESNDKFSFRQDMTFTIIEEGVVKEGTWEVIDAAKNMLSLAFKEGVTKQVQIRELEQDLLVYDIMVDWEHSVTVYMTAMKEGLPAFQTFHLTEGEGISLHSLFRP